MQARSSIRARFVGVSPAGVDLRLPLDRDHLAYAAETLGRLTRQQAA